MEESRNQNSRESVSSPKFNWHALWKMFRVHQAAKNILIFFVLLANPKMINLTNLSVLGIGFIAFSMTSFAMYVINDLFDLTADRQHQQKKYRPLASGAVVIEHGMAAAMVCLGLALALQYTLHNLHFSIVLTLYLVVSLLYSHWLKQLMIVDVVALAFLYILRVVAGVMLLDETLSAWFLIFFACFFLSLAFLKRYIELNSLKANQMSIPRRAYTPHDKASVRMAGVTLGLLAAMVFLLYAHSVKAQSLFHHLLWLQAGAALLSYWVARIWWLASANKVDSDPVLFVLKDKVTYVVGSLMVVVMLMAQST